VLNQTFGDFEFLILNDSPENKELDSIVRSYRDKRIIYRKNKKNLGISDARNKLLDMSRGEYIAVCDHDDVSFPERFAKEVDFLDNNPNYGVVSSDYIENENWDVVYTHLGYENIDIKNNNHLWSCTHHSAAMIRKSILDEFGCRYERRYSPTEDWHLFMQLIEFTMFKTLDEVLVSYYVGTDNTSKRHIERVAVVCDELRWQFRNKYPFKALEQNLAVLRDKIDALEKKIDLL
jgi:glycosyltransferase involved in cell wall biosynthesis